MIRSTLCRRLMMMVLLATSLPMSFATVFGQVASPPTAQQLGTQTLEDKDKLDLEKERLRAQTEKLKAEAWKFEWDRYTGWIAPAVSILGVPILILTMVMQRRTAMKVQEGTRAPGDFKLQGEEARAALELKIADFIMSSRSPAMARMRAELLSGLYIGMASAASSSMR
jgi:hypothetical protein